MPGTPDRPAVLLIAHGSRHEPANQELEDLADRMRLEGSHAIVEACFLELAEPDIAAGGARCVDRGAKLVLMIPYFLSSGVHLLRDLTAARDALAKRFPGAEFRLGPPLGPHPLLDQLVAVRVADLESGRAGAIVVAPEVSRRYATDQAEG
ncbi:sirohydrochlorin chelatase [Aquisphaera insulae]|uniref:sirohydrochlorin chelatase n=1 Tax=Aquisphaera insulae TaxID=2712864 RepID=UPI0013EB1005|nr:CbiX/SirB N-terminal domain-containing protein [Aquisphaera insulae]